MTRGRGEMKITNAQDEIDQIKKTIKAHRARAQMAEAVTLPIGQFLELLDLAEEAIKCREGKR